MHWQPNLAFRSLLIIPTLHAEFTHRFSLAEHDARRWLQPAQYCEVLHSS